MHGSIPHEKRDRNVDGTRHSSFLESVQQGITSWIRCTSICSDAQCFSGRSHSLRLRPSTLHGATERPSYCPVPEPFGGETEIVDRASTREEQALREAVRQFCCNHAPEEVRHKLAGVSKTKWSRGRAFSTIKAEESRTGPKNMAERGGPPCSNTSSTKNCRCFRSRPTRLRFQCPDGRYRDLNLRKRGVEEVLSAADCERRRSVMPRISEPRRVRISPCCPIKRGVRATSGSSTKTWTTSAAFSRHDLLPLPHECRSDH